MALLSELRYPTRWYSKSIATVLALSFFTFVAAAIISGFVVYNIVTPRGGNLPIDLANFPGHPEQISYSVESVGAREAWFFPGLKSAPTILLCPGYGEGRTRARAQQDKARRREHAERLRRLVGIAIGGDLRPVLHDAEQRKADDEIRDPRGGDSRPTPPRQPPTTTGLDRLRAAIPSMVLCL